MCVFIYFIAIERAVLFIKASEKKKKDLANEKEKKKLNLHLMMTSLTMKL